jgi:hypothetical protein
LAIATNARRASIATLAVLLAACGSEAPQQPSVVATPAPTPTPTPEPTPEPTPIPVPVCQLQPKPDCGADCCSESDEGLFDDEIVQAQASLLTHRPELFDPDGTIRREIPEAEYTQALADEIMIMFPGMCARSGGKPSSISADEIAIKRSNDVSQNVDVILGSNYSQSITGYYTCRPASF